MSAFLSIFLFGLLSYSHFSQAKSLSDSLGKTLDLASGSALVIDANTYEVLYSKNADLQVPIASITKLMTAMVVLDSGLPLDEVLSVYIAETKELKGVYSRVKVGSKLTRQELLLLALMSSENRAASTLAHYYPGGQAQFVSAMNVKAKMLGMEHTRYSEPTGLSASNVSTAKDLSKLLLASREYPLLSQWSTTKEKTVSFVQPRYSLGFRNTNHLIYNDDWRIYITKTGFTNAAGHCLAMRASIDNRDVALVVLDAFGKYTHFADAKRLRSWLESGTFEPVPIAAKSYRKQKEQNR